MEKQIKDYLKYYIGCKCFCEKSNYSLVHNISLHNGDYFDLTIRMLYGMQGQSTSLIKPVLRKISSMTDEEVIECGDMGYKFSEDPNPEMHSKKEHFEDLLLPQQFHYLLSKNFDLFNLIDEGLALDAETITTK